MSMENKWKSAANGVAIGVAIPITFALLVMAEIAVLDWIKATFGIPASYWIILLFVLLICGVVGGIVGWKCRQNSVD